MRKIFLVVVLLWSVNSISQVYFPPVNGSVWDTLSPSSLNWCPEKIDMLYDFLERTNTKSFMVLKDGKIVLEKYFGTFTADSNYLWNSAGKTLVALMTGIAQKEGFLALSDTSSTYLGTGWTSLTPVQEEKITIQHQLSMTTGMDDATNSGCTDPICLTYIADAGTRWSYHNAPYTLLHSVISNATGQNFNTYIASKLGISCGINGVFLNLGFNKVFVSNTRSFARFGLLLMSKGIWNGNPVLNDTAYFQQMTTSTQSINPSYGYLTWLNGKSNFMIPTSQISFSGSLLPNAPSDMYAALGKDGQIINVVPSQSLVLVRMGEGDGITQVGTQYNDSIWVRMNDLECNLGIDALHDNLPFYLFPNPSQNQFEIKGLRPSDEMIIYNSVGQSVSFKREGQQISVVSPGLFYLQINRESKLHHLKLVIE